MNKLSKPRMTLALILLALCFTGCGEHRNTGPGAAKPTFQREESSKQVVMIVMDLSGSFTSKMAEDGEAYEFAIHVIDRYFRRRDPINLPFR